MDKGGRTLWTFGELDEPEMARAAFRTITDLPRNRPRRLRIDTIDDNAAAKGPHETLLRELGFFRDVSSMVHAHTPVAPAR